MRLRKARISLLVVVLVSAIYASAGTPVKVMTYNVDEGTDFAAIIAVLTSTNPTAAQFQQAVLDTEADVTTSDPIGRAALIAGEISAANPDLVGLQEAAQWTFGATQIDLLQLILAYLPNYTALVTVPEFQINIPGLVGFMDRDVILVRTDEPAILQIVRTGQGHYLAQIPLPAFPPYLQASSITRGWGYVDARMNGTPFRFITTHLEDGTNTTSPLFAYVQALQEIQLVYSPALTILPVIIGGDFNTVANDSSSPTFATYRFMLANGFSDAWSTVNPNLPGFTCCQEMLTDPSPELTQRLDQIFMRNHVGPAAAQVVGAEEVDGFSWPSDHAAVFATGAVSRIF
jgi:endonuclease/exonuclease/phosphatase family metal-dependent hydrolase